MTAAAPMLTVLGKRDTMLPFVEYATVSSPELVALKRIKLTPLPPLIVITLDHGVQEEL